MIWLLILAAVAILWVVVAVAFTVWFLRAIVREAEHDCVQAEPGSGVR